MPDTCTWVNKLLCNRWTVVFFAQSNTVVFGARLLATQSTLGERKNARGMAEHAHFISPKPSAKVINDFSRLSLAECYTFLDFPKNIVNPPSTTTDLNEWLIELEFLENNLVSESLFFARLHPFGGPSAVINKSFPIEIKLRLSLVPRFIYATARLVELCCFHCYAYFVYTSLVVMTTPQPTAFFAYMRKENLSE